MNITLSLALSADYCLDDCSQERLVLSTPQDWLRVYQLRAASDAILIGAGTLRADNPTLGLKGCRGEAPLRVVVSGEGELSPRSRIFNVEGGSSVLVFSRIERPELSGKAEVIVSAQIDVPFIITELEKRGVENLMVEGGAQILRLFLESAEVNTLRLACNPSVKVSDENAPHFNPEKWLDGKDAEVEDLGGMIVKTYKLKDSRAISEHERLLLARTIEHSHKSPKKDSCYRVGAIVETAAGEIFEGYTLEGSPTHHAEQVAIYKAQAAGVDLRGATIYSSLEPCSVRSSEKESCSEIIIRLGFARAVFAMYEPSHFVECHGAENLRRAGVEVIYCGDLAEQVRLVNAHVLG